MPVAKYLISIPGTAVFLTAAVVSAQSPQLSPDAALPHTDTRSIQQSSQQARSQSGKSSIRKNVTLTVKDSAVAYVIKELGKQAGLPVVFNSADAAFSKKIDVSVSDTDVLDALEIALKGTGLIAKYADDGRTILVSRRIPAQESSSARETGGIAGRIVDSATNAPISGANITIAALKLSVQSRYDGTFSINGVPEGSHLISVRLIGYKSQDVRRTVESGKTLTIDITLVPSAMSLSEVVTTVTGSQRRIEVPTDIVKINADEVRERAPVRNVVDLIEAAQVPGVLITREGGDPGSASQIRIRGLGSISQSNDPVMIIDGVWVDATVSKPSRFDNLDPASIETVEIVRGPSAATLYGQDAANGVIVITTKKGKAGPTRWNLSYKRDWGQTYGKQPLFYSGVGMSPLLADPIWCSITKVLDNVCTQDSVIVVDPNSRLLSREGTETKNNWTAQMDGGSSNVTYSVTLSTGNTIGVRRTSEAELIRFRKVGYKVTPEFVTPSELRTNNVTTAITFVPRSNITIGMTLTGGQTSLKDNVINTNWPGLLGLISKEFNNDTLLIASGSGSVSAKETPVKSSTGVIAGNIQYRPLDVAVINGHFGAEKINATESLFERRASCSVQESCQEEMGFRSEKSETKSVYTLRLNASTSLNLGSLNRFLDIRPSIGGDYRKTDQYLVSVSKDKVPVGDRSINSGELSASSNIDQENAIAGWFVNSTIGLFGRVYFDIGIRQDIGSAITSSNDALYPKIGGSWLVSDESFWRDNYFVNSLRLRSAIGHAAVQPDPSDIDGKFVQGTKWIDGRFVSTSDLSATGNSRLQPERSVELELGFDADMIDNRLNLVATYAHKVNRNTLVLRTLPPSFGAIYSANRKENVAKVRNRNFELSAMGRVIESRTALLVLNYTLTLSDNKVITLGDGIAPFTVREARIAAGYPLESAWEREVLGYRDANKDGLLSPDEIIQSDSVVYLGWSQPRYRAGYGVTLTLKNQLVFDSRFAYQSRYIQRYGQGVGAGAEDVNSPLSEQALNVISGISPKLLSDVRWNSASVTYHLPTKFLQKFGGRSVSVSLQGSNLALWSNYVGRDPGINSGMFNDTGFQDDGLTPPRPRLYVLDFKVGL